MLAHAPYTSHRFNQHGHIKRRTIRRRAPTADADADAPTPTQQRSERARCRRLSAQQTLAPPQQQQQQHAGHVLVFAAAAAVQPSRWQQQQQAASSGGPARQAFQQRQQPLSAAADSYARYRGEARHVGHGDVLLAGEKRQCREERGEIGSVVCMSCRGTPPLSRSHAAAYHLDSGRIG